MNLLEGKKILILGVANERSIAWGIANECKKAGAQLAFTYPNEAIEKRLRPLAEELGADFIAKCDVTNDEDFEKLRELTKQQWGSVDGLVHSVAFAQSDDLKRAFSETTREGFRMALDISAYSLIGLTKAFRPIMAENSSIVSMTYEGSVKVIKNYNVMGVAKAALESSMRYLADDLGNDGVRVNCLSAGPIKTLAASGISGFRNILKTVEETAPLKSNITIEDVGQYAVFLMSHLSQKITGQICYIDSGMSIKGLC